MSRLEFGPEPKEMEVTDIATGHFVFRPVEGEEVSFEALDEAIRNAGYEIENATVTVAGTVTDERHLETPAGRLYHLTAAGGPAGEPPENLEPGDEVTVTGGWSAAEGVEIVEGAKVVDPGQGGVGDAEGSAPEPGRRRVRLGAPESGGRATGGAPRRTPR